MRIFGCRRFSRLSNEAIDRDLCEREETFLEKHRTVCASCAATQTQSSFALNMLRASAIDVDISPSFDDRLLRKLRVRTTRESLRYWSPAVAGAFIAGLAVVAAMQMITRSAQLPHVGVPGGEARRIQLVSPALDQNIDTSVLK